MEIVLDIGIYVFIRQLRSDLIWDQPLCKMYYQKNIFRGWCILFYNNIVFVTVGIKNILLLQRKYGNKYLVSQHVATDWRGTRYNR